MTDTVTVVEQSTAVTVSGENSYAVSVTEAASDYDVTIQQGAATAFSAYLNDLHDVSVTGVTDGQVLSYQASTSTWIPETPTAGPGGSGYDVSSISSITYSPSDTTGHRIILCNTASNNITVTLPTAAGNNVVFDIKKVSGNNSLITNTTGGETIDDGASATILTNGPSITVVSDGTNWRII